MEETFIKHLEFIQNIINRMSNNSFLLKGMTTKRTKKNELFSLSTDKYESQVSSWFRTLWSKSIVGLHGIVVTTILFAVAMLLMNP